MRKAFIDMGSDGTAYVRGDYGSFSVPPQKSEYEKRMRDLAIAFAGGEKVLVSDARGLSVAFLRMLAKIRDLEHENDRIRAGESVQESNPARVGMFKTLNKDGKRSLSAIERGPAENLNRLIKAACRVETGGMDTQFITGSQKGIDFHRKICGAINERVQEIYDMGLSDGRDILLGLNDGTVAPGNFPQTPSREIYR